jgi:hypothetical protein
VQVFFEKRKRTRLGTSEDERRFFLIELVALIGKVQKVTNPEESNSACRQNLVCGFPKGANVRPL